jgi:DNA mismatch repair ATPase MutS
MSKLLNKLNDLKKQDASSIYVFRVGIFYNIFNEDAKILNEKLGLKLTSLSPEITKCGFPISSLEKYTKKLDNLQLKYKIIDDLPQSTNIVDYSNNIELKKILKKITEIDMNNTTFQQSFNILLDLQNKLKNILGG